MSEISKKEKEITFKRIRGDASNDMFEAIQNCSKIAKSLSLTDEKIPNITTAYNNKIIELEKEFKKAKIDFYDREECETRFIIENRLQGSIIMATQALRQYMESISASKEDIDSFVDSYRKPSTFEKIFKRAKYAPKKSVLSEEELEKARLNLRNYLNYCNEIYDFTISDNIVEAILYYKSIAIERKNTDFDSRIDTVDSELQKLGYESVKPIVEEESKKQDLSFANIKNLKQVKLSRRKEPIER